MLHLHRNGIYVPSSSTGSDRRDMCYNYAMASFYSLLETEVLAGTVSLVHRLVAPVAKINQLQRVTKCLLH